MSSHRSPFAYTVPMQPAWLKNWLDRHQNPTSFWLHMTGIPLTIAAVIPAGIQLSQWRWDLAALRQVA